jgi:hypothetical protein
MAMDSLEFHLGLPCPTLLNPAGGPPLKRPNGLQGLQGWLPAGVFYPLGHPKPYTYASKHKWNSPLFPLPPLLMNDNQFSLKAKCLLSSQTELVKVSLCIKKGPQRWHTGECHGQADHVKK